MKIKILNSLLLFLFCMTVQSQNVGDPGVTPDPSKYDSNYPQMDRWANAGVVGGIPFTNATYFAKTSTLDGSANNKKSSDINAAITSLSNSLVAGEKGLLTLKNGDYTIDVKVTMKSNVSIIGESRTGVICTITMASGDGFYFDNVQNCGIYSLTIQGSWGVPQYSWTYGVPNNGDTGITSTNISVKLKNGANNCWLDKVTILNSATHPLRCNANQNTFRDLIVDGVHNKGGGAEGYFFITGADNLITRCQMTHLRHFTIQNPAAQYNVVYDNDFNQEVSFHVNDGGNNLIENNRIILPSDMPPLAPGEIGLNEGAETQTDGPYYFAIMGPWSSQHSISAFPNYIFKNTCVQNNHTEGSSTPWSDSNTVYTGPVKLGKTLSDRITNFPDNGLGAPTGSTLYAIKGTSLSVENPLLDDIDSEAIVIYPNPVSNILTVSASRKIKSLKIIDLTGKHLKSFILDKAVLKKEILLNSSLDHGVYFLVVDLETGERETRRFVKQ